MHVFGGMKKLVQLKFVQLFLLNRVKVRWSENRAAQGFHFINSFISNFFGPNSKTCTCKVRAAQGRVSRGLTVQLKLSIFAACLSQIRNEPIKCDSDLTKKFLNKHMDKNDHDDRLDEKLCLFRYIHKSRGEQCLWNRNWDLGRFWAGWQHTLI